MSSPKLDGVWKIVDYPQHVECVGVKFDITPSSEEGENFYNLQVQIANTFIYTLKYDPETHEWKVPRIKSTLRSGTKEELDQEQTIKHMILEIEKIEVEGRQRLTIDTKDGEKVILNHLH